MFEKVKVEEISRSANARRTQIDFDKKTITAPVYGTLLKRKFELDLLCSDFGTPLENVKLIGTKLSDTEKVIREKEGKTETKTLYDYGISFQENEREYKYLRNNNVWYVDPCTDEYPHKYEGFSKELQDLIDSDTTMWNTLLTNSTLFMKFVRENVLAQILNKADFIIPPTPLIRADDPKYIIDAWYEITKTTGSYVKTNYNKNSSIIINLHYNNFMRTDHLKTIVKKLENDRVETEIGDIKLILLKIQNHNQFLIDPAAAMLNYQDFIFSLSNYAINTHRAVILLNSDSFGLPSIALGLDGFTEPLDGVTGGMQRSKDKHGRYYHPEGLKFYPYRSIRELYERQGKKLPCNCKFCSSMAGKDLDIDIKLSEWNWNRRGHLLVNRNSELRECHEEILGNTIAGGIKNKLARSDIKNYLDLLPGGIQ